MKILLTLIQILFIYSISLVGEWIHIFFHIPIPGSIIGMILLFTLLSLNIIPEKWITLGANFFLTYMALFFIPATVGVMNYLNLFQGNGLLIVLGTIISTCLVMVSSGFVVQKLSERVSKKEQKAA